MMITMERKQIHKFTFIIDDEMGKEKYIRIFEEIRNTYLYFSKDIKNLKVKCF